MCGRYGDMASDDHWRERFGVDPPEGRVTRRQLAPTEPIAVVAPDHSSHWARWGLFPYWSKSLTDAKRGSVINARVESLGSKALFRYASQHRVLVPATHFFEWMRQGAHKTPYLIRRRDRDAMSFAGIEARWRDPASGERIITTAIVTREAEGAMRQLHDRIPLILRQEDEAIWLDEEIGLEQVLERITPVAVDELTAIPVGSAVNKADADNEDLLTPVGEPLF